MSVFEFKSIDDVGAGKPNQTQYAVHGRFTLKDDCERQFWNEQLRELKERINDVVHEQLAQFISKVLYQLTTLWPRIVLAVVLKRTIQLPMNVR